MPRNVIPIDVFGWYLVIVEKFKIKLSKKVKVKKEI